MNTYFKLVSSVRWKIGILMFVGVAVNYLDRVSISHAIISIAKDFNLDNIEKGWVLSAFSMGYVLFMMIGGYAVFRYGSRLTLTISTLLLSLATCMSGFSTNFYHLFLSRFLIGTFEAPTFPANAYSVSKWFPKTERGKATGLFDSGSYVGSALAAPLIIIIIFEYSWRICFIISGLIGVIWTLGWYVYFRDDPQEHSSISKEEKIIIGNDTSKEIIDANKIPWLKFLSNRKVLGLSLGFFCYNYIKNFHLTWFPIFLIETKSVDFLKLSYLGMIPPLFAILGELLTGYLIDSFVSRGYSSALVKKLSISTGFILSTVITLTLYTDNMLVVIFLISLSYTAIISASVGIWSIPDELAPNKKSVAVIGSIQNTFSNVAGIVAPVITGYAYEYTGSFFLPFLISCIVTVVGIFSYWGLVGDLTVIEA